MFEEFPPTDLFVRGPNRGSVQATQLWEGTYDTLTFNHWLELLLCLMLSDKHVVVLDNATFDHSTTNKEIIEHAGATLLFFLPYSPDFNPIEQDFAAIKKRREFHANEQINNSIFMLLVL